MPVEFRACALQHGMGWMRESKEAESLQRKSQAPNATSAVLPALKLLALCQLHVCFFANSYKGPKFVKRCKGAEPEADTGTSGPPAAGSAPGTGRDGNSVPGRAGAAGPAGASTGHGGDASGPGRVGARPPLQQGQGEGRSRPPPTAAAGPAPPAV